MDRNFLEFYGNMLINAAKSHKQWEEMTRWMNRGFSDITDWYKKFWTPPSDSSDSPSQMKAWETSAEGFRNAFTEYMNLMGMVPKADHLNLIKKYEELKEKVETQEETIRHLRMLLSEKGVEQGEVVKTFHDLLKHQGDQFQELLNNFSMFYNKPSDKPAKPE